MHKVNNKLLGAFLDQDSSGKNNHAQSNQVSIEMEQKMDRMLEREEFKQTMKNSDSKIQMAYS